MGHNVMPLGGFWISVTERVPPVGELVFVAMYEGEIAYHVLCRGGMLWKHVHHWAPIPPLSREGSL